VQYTIKDVWRLERFVPMDNILESGWINERAAFLEDLIDCVLESGSTCRDIPKEVFDNVGMVLPIMTVMSLSAILHSQWPAVLWLVGLTVRTHIASLLPKFPPTSTIQRWKKDRGVRRRAVAEAGASGSSRGLPAYDDIVLELPRAKRCRKADRSTGEPNKGKIADIDPVRMIKALTLSTLLRSQRDFKTALTAARGWEAADSDDDGAVPDDAVHASSLWRGFARCDITYMLLFRREWYADFLHDLIECITIFTDSSPNSGLEFQGMIATVRKTSGDFYSVTLPGSTLAYGLQDVLSKTIALVWSVWLLTGPDVASVEYFFNKVTCVTTDGGVELGTTLVPNILYAFMRWVSGAPFDSLHSFVRPNELLLPVAIRILGWSHSFGNLSKSTAWTWKKFDSKLEMIRRVVTFWRNKTWRSHVKKALCGRSDLDLTCLKKSPPRFGEVALPNNS